MTGDPAAKQTYQYRQVTKNNSKTASTWPFECILLNIRRPERNPGRPARPVQYCQARPRVRGFDMLKVLESGWWCEARKERVKDAVH